MKQDKKTLQSSDVLYNDTKCHVVLLPVSPAATRYSGIYSNQLTTDNPDKAFAVLTSVDGGYRVSIRAPKNNPTGASDLALQFTTGGGRSKAAGINLLPESQLKNFIDKFKLHYSIYPQSD